MTPFIQQAIADRKLGLALHYPLIHATVVGLNAKRTFEFGAGGSTRVFVDAGHGAHISLSTASMAELREAYNIWSRDTIWAHYSGLSQTFRDIPYKDLDIVLHDGSHAADVVEEDIAWVWPRIKRYGLLFVHDTQHSYVGQEMRAGLRRALDAVKADCSVTTLPYGFGLTIVRKESGTDIETISPATAKAGGQHTTEPCLV